MESSRIFVRALPPKWTEDDFRKHFAKFPVTDVKMFPARRIGYVGYKTPEDAAKAVKFFNKSFVKMTKILVEIARPINDQNLPKSQRQRKEERGASRHTEPAPLPNENPLKRKRAGVQEEQDPKLKEFLDVMQPPSKTKTWANVALQDEPAVKAKEDVAADTAIPEGESDDEYQVIAKKSKTSQTRTHSNTVEPSPPRQPAALLENGGAASEPDPERTTPQEVTGGREAVSDADWLRSHTKRTLEVDGAEGEAKTHASPIFASPSEKADTHDDDEQPAKENAVIPRTKDEEIDDAAPSEEDKIRQTGRLYLRNLSYAVTEDDLRNHFFQHGALEEVHVPVASTTGTGKGFAFLQFLDHEQAVQAFSQEDGTIFQGRLLHIISAKAKREVKMDEFAIAKLPLKKQKEMKRRSEAGNSTFNWNSLYLNTDAVLSTVANRLGISKGELLDPTSSHAAVTQAKAETHLIQETKSYFTQHGVDLEAFKYSSKGDTAILVKNIPAQANPDDIRKLFEEHGTVNKFLMPPSGMTAIVEFPNGASAKSAFKSLAYRKIMDSVLFLEKAPKDLFKVGAVTASTVAPIVTSDARTTKLSATDLLEDVAKPDATNTATLYIRNLSFSTTTDGLKETFSSLNGFRSAKVSTKIDPKRGVLSMGFGFVEFSDTATASAAQKAMNGYKLDGHELQIRASHKGADAAEERRKEDAAKKAAGTKIIIKNLPFEASKTDIRALFSPYGQLRSVRLPKKFDSTSRGFAFCEFSTKKEASSAMEALRNTHLLGRRLVLAFAEAEAADPEKELEKMQQKVGAQANKVALQKLTGGGRKKFNVAGNDDLDEA
ncbi:RNA-binding domain-containing protein [Polyplosphaeria fusca]|uniref:Multiple RNA-binding domain-containing protein 1 n=1 Tax=Polyplosphaeria fusca TaxID=682080 RepID=A0A9P4R300_9PLEO|nr:RNA-binding domain-containing protein [Polyplosphaeria fusca]